MSAGHKVLFLSCRQPQKPLQARSHVCRIHSSPNDEYSWIFNYPYVPSFNLICSVTIDD